MRRVVGAVVVLALAGLFGLTALRFVDSSRSWPTMAAAFSSYAVIGFVVTLVVSLLLLRGSGRRRPVLALVLASVVGVAVQVYWLAPLYVGGGGHGDLVVMSSNLEFGNGDAATVVRTAASRGVDVLVLEEVTPDGFDALEKAGVSELLPHRAGDPATGARGTMVLSRYGLSEVAPLAVGNGGLDVRVAAPRPFRLLAVHTKQPVKNPGRWHDDMELLRGRVHVAAGEGPMLAVGDFNATRDHVLLRRILGEGVVDAAEQAGSGWQPTWPSSSRGSSPWPLLALDHVLAGEGFTAVRTSTVEVPHTDHLALVVMLRTGNRD